ncbi:restriction endonuclease [Leptospira noguchii]|uniref:nSTAND3 domain-containing NTPase n=1 Tax=Leptospira noguchii TaxID=28182 RepID=UPI000772D96B|nr:restriction endonuclease [Leptospira noguchii]
MQYSFESINDKEFEILAIDILSKYFNIRIERFKSGKDQGVDGRFFSSDNQEIIIQCKHYYKSGFKLLFRKLKSDEIKSIQKLSPKRYILLTSTQLSKQNKQKIFHLLSPYIESEKDIFGNEDLNDLLSKYSDIERKHYKLWISSTNVLQTIMNNALVGRSKFKLDEISVFLPKYAETKDHAKAIQKLEKNRVLILTGEAGIGKTTLADQISFLYAKNGYEFVYIDNAISEAESIYFEGKNQIFYFDDFLGRNYLEALEKKEDSKILNFIKRIHSSNDKYFILTSRTAILKQGKELSDLFHIDNIGKNEYELHISNYSAIDKAKILYNHIWHSLLHESFVSEFYIDFRYLKVIKHKNFNPRLIAFITDFHKVANIKNESYWEYIKNMLNNPKELWDNIFNLQFDSFARLIPCLIVFNGGSISEKELKEAYFKIVHLEKLNVSASFDHNYEKVIRITVGSITNRIIEPSGKITYELFNPSVADFILDRLSDNEAFISNIYLSLKTAKSIRTLFNLRHSGSIDERIIESIFVQLIENRNGIPNYEFDAYLVFYLLMNGFTYFLQSKAAIQLIEIISMTEIENIDAKIQIMSYAIGKKIITGVNKTHLLFYENYIDEYDSPEELKALVTILKKLNDFDTSKLREKTFDFWMYNITQSVLDDGILDDYKTEEESDEACDTVIQYLKDESMALNIHFSDNELNRLLSRCDLDKILERNLKAREVDDTESENNADENQEDSDNGIIDLFERT